MFTLVGYQQSVDAAGVLTAINACADQHVAVSGTRIFVPELNKLVAEYAAYASGTYHARLQSPSLRRVALLDIAVIQQALAPTANESYQPHFSCPITLDVNEGLEALVAKSAAGADMATILVWLADGALTPVVGEIFTVKITASITSAIGSWVNGAISFTQVLPVGRYAIVGASMMEHGGDLIAFRFVVPGYGWRPGGLATTNYGSKSHRLQRYGGMGVWCEFDSTTPPTIDILAAAAGAQTIDGYIDLMKVG